MTDAVRTCILSREESPREGLIRLVLSPEGEVLPDIRAKAPGRGAWISVDKAGLAASRDKGRLKGALSRSFRTGDLLMLPPSREIPHARLIRLCRKILAPAM